MIVFQVASTFDQWFTLDMLLDLMPEVRDEQHIQDMLDELVSFVQGKSVKAHISCF